MSASLGKRMSAVSARTDAAACGVGLFFLLVYLTRVAHSVSVFGDSAELSSAAIRGIPAHPPGYPLLTVLGHLLFRVAGDAPPDFLLHATSAVFHAAALGIFLRFLVHATGSLSLGVVGAVLLGMARSYFLGSLYYETFPLNDLLSVWMLERAAALGRAPTPKRCVWLGVALGLAAGHHQMAVLFAPLALFLAAPARAQLGCREFAASLGVLLFVFASSVLLLGALGQAQFRGPFDLLSYVTRERYGGLLSSNQAPSSWAFFEREAGLFALLTGSLGRVAMLMAGFGVVDAFRRRDRLGLGFFATAVLAGPIFFALNRVSIANEENWAWVERFTTLAHFPLVALVSLGAGRLIRLSPERYAPVAFLGMSLCLGAEPLAESWRLDLRNDLVGVAFSEDLLREAKPGGLLLVTGDLQVSILDRRCATAPGCGTVRVMGMRRGDYAALREAFPKRGLPLLGAEQRVAREGLAAVLRAFVGTRPVSVSPQLLLSHPEWTNEYQVVPGLLLIHLLPKATDPRAALAEEIASALDGCSLCRLDRRPRFRPSMVAQVERFYATGFSNLLQFAERGAGSQGTRDALRERKALFASLLGRSGFEKKVSR